MVRAGWFSFFFIFEAIILIKNLYLFFTFVYSCEAVFLSEARLKLHIESNKTDRGRSGVLPVSVSSVNFGRSHGVGDVNGGRGEDVVAVKRKKKL